MDELISKASAAIPEDICQRIVHIFINSESGPISEKASTLLKKIVKTNQSIASFIFKIKISSESVFQTIFKDSSLKIDNVVSLLKENRNSAEIFNNSIIFAKNKDEKIKELCEILL